jgi:hypothetical protein
MKRHDEIIALKIRAERLTKEVRQLRDKCDQLQAALDSRIHSPTRHFEQLVDLDLAVAEWSRLPWWRRLFASPRDFVTEVAALEVAT